MKTEPDSHRPAIAAKEPEPVPYTLKIGVTGHRNLDNPLAVSIAVENLLLQIKQSLETGMTDLYQPQTAGKDKWQMAESHVAWHIKKMLAFAGLIPKLTESERHTPLNWKVISSLAKGADSIVARSAIDKVNASAEVVLPFGIDEYRKDFGNQNDLDEFNELVSKAGNNAYINQIAFRKNNLREEAYEQAGIEVVDSCEILLAVWDGKPARGRGGTAEMVKYACSVNRLVVWINALEPGLSPVIVTNIKSITESQDDTNSGHLQVSSIPLPKYAAGWSSGYLQEAEYNRDKAFRKKIFDDIFQKTLARLEKARKETSLLPEHIHPVLNVLLPHYSRADTLALRYQKLHTRSATWLYRLAAIAVAAAVFQTLYFPTQTIWVLIEILALAGAVLWFRISLVQHWHEKWLNYRHLAERLRILMFHSLPGKQTATQSIQNQQLPFYPGPGGWVLDVFDLVKADIPVISIPSENFSDVKKIILTGWISNQAEYHGSNAISKKLLAQRRHKIIATMLAATLVAAILHLLKVVHDPFLENFIIAMVIILPAFASAEHAIGSINDFERIATRSAKMNELLISIEQRINNTSGWEDLKNEIRRAEDIMSAENHEWCVSLSFRRVSLPV